VRIHPYSLDDPLAENLKGPHKNPFHGKIQNVNFFARALEKEELYPDVDWGTYCSVAKLKHYIGQRVICCGLVIEQRLHRQSTGELMKFLSLADKTGIVETELFADTYRSYGTATIHYPVLEVDASVEPYDNGRGFTLRVHRVGKPRPL
jgi:DNA polymerase III alpha subunit